MYFSQSDLFILLISSIQTHLYLATYGAGLKPGKLHISSNSSSLTLNDADVGVWSNPTTQNILPPIENTRSCSHFISSVTAVIDRQMACMSSIFIKMWVCQFDGYAINFIISDQGIENRSMLNYHN